MLKRAGVVVELFDSFLAELVMRVALSLSSTSQQVATMVARNMIMAVAEPERAHTVAMTRSKSQTHKLVT